MEQDAAFDLLNSGRPGSEAAAAHAQGVAQQIHVAGFGYPLAPAKLLLRFLFGSPIRHQVVEFRVRTLFITPKCPVGSWIYWVSNCTNTH
jgi:hypothetical protein